MTAHVGRPIMWTPQPGDRVIVEVDAGALDDDTVRTLRAEFGPDVLVLEGVRFVAVQRRSIYRWTCGPCGWISQSVDRDDVVNAAAEHLREHGSPWPPDADGRWESIDPDGRTTRL